MQEETHNEIDEVRRVMRGEWPRDLVNPQAKGNYVLKWGPMKETSALN